MRLNLTWIGGELEVNLGVKLQTWAGNVLFWRGTGGAGMGGRNETQTFCSETALAPLKPGFITLKFQPQDEFSFAAGRPQNQEFFWLCLKSSQAAAGWVSLVIWEKEKSP